MDTTGLAELSPAALVIGKATAVLLLALLLTAVMQRASATSRHLVWVASLLALVAIPLLTLWSPVRIAVLPTTWNVAGTVATGSVFATDGADASRVARAVRVGVLANPRDLSASARANPRSTAPSFGEQAPENTSPSATAIGPSAPVATDNTTASGPISAVALIAVVWATVALGLTLRLACGFWSVRRIVRTGTPLVDASWQGAMIDIADRLELDATPRLLRADAVTMPFACGPRTPTIVLPGDCDTWSDERRAAVLLHELAHIRRRDIVGHTLGRLVCAVYWFHPLAWTAARRLRAEAERACDDLALGCGTRASDYAEHLLDIVTSVRNHYTPSVAMAMATRSEFEGRMLAILDPHLSRTAPTRLQASTLAGGVMMFAIVTGSAVPRATNASQSGLPTTEGAQVVVLQDTALHRATRADTMTPTSEFAEQRRSGGPVASAEPSARPAPVSTPAATAEAWPAPTVAKNATVRAVDPLSSLPAAHNAVDSSARATVLARILRTDTASSLRRTAAWGLNEFPRNAAALEALLYAIRNDPSADVREMAAWSLSAEDLDLRVTMELAYVIRTDADKSVRRTAIWSLSEGADARSPAIVAALVFALGYSDTTVRELAAWGLGNATPKHAPPALIAALRDSDAHMRATVAWALFRIEDGDAAPALETALLKEPDSDTKWAMVRAISVMGERAVAPLQRIIEGSDAAARALAIRALAGHGGDPWPQPRPRPRPFP